MKRCCGRGGQPGRSAGRRDGALRFLDALDRGFRRKVAAVDRVYSSEERVEGARAFAEKCDQVWWGGVGDGG